MFRLATLSDILIKITALGRPAWCAGVLVAGLIMASIANAQIYSWTDSQGRTHFSQTPPDKDTTTTSAPELVAPSHLPRMAPRFHNGDVYCGKEKLPTQKGDTEQHLVYLARLRLHEEERASASQDRSRCVLHWISTEMDRHQKALSMLQSEYKALLAEYQNLTVGVDRKCSHKSGGWIVGPAAQAWADCHIPAGKRANAMEKRLTYLRPLITSEPKPE